MLITKRWLQVKTNVTKAPTILHSGSSDIKQTFLGCGLQVWRLEVFENVFLWPCKIRADNEKQSGGDKTPW